MEQEQERQIERLRSSIHDRHRTRGACAMVRCASRLCHTRYASAWTSWCDAVDAKAKGGRLLRGCIGRLTQGRKGSAWRRWVQHVEGGRQEELVREWQGRLEAVGLRYERERAAHASSRLASCLRRLRSRWCAQAWGEWCSAAGVSEYVRRAVSVSVHRWAHRSQACAWRRWLGQVASGREAAAAEAYEEEIARLRAAHGREVRMRAAGMLLRWVEGAVRVRVLIVWAHWSEAVAS